MPVDDQLAEALRDVRRENAHRMNFIRVGGTGAVAATALLAMFIMDPAAVETNGSWEISLVGSTVYFICSVFLLLAARKYRAARRFSRFAVPFVDMPIVVAIQSANILDSGVHAGHISEFSISILVCLVLLSAFTLDLRQIWLTLLLAVAGEQLLQHLAGIGVGGRVYSVVIFGVVAWIVTFAGSNRLELIHRITSANARRLRLQKYFSPGVGELLERHDEDMLRNGSECELTVVFTDIRGFTRMAEEMSGPETIAFLNIYHSRMVAAVFAHGGTLDKYLGDGLMIYFNAPVGQPDHASRAVQCALAMRRELASLNTERSLLGQDELRIGIGIHTGHAVLGDIGAPHRREFTAIGDAVNVAARLEELTKELGEDVLVSRSTVDLVGDLFTWREIGRVEIRGRAEGMELFSPGTEPGADS